MAVDTSPLTTTTTAHEWLKQQGKALLAYEWTSSACRFVCTPHFETAYTAAL